MKKHILGAKICLVSTTFLLGLMICGTQIANENKNAISNYLGQSNFEIQKDETDNEDAEHYKSKYSNVKDLVNDGKKLAQKIEEEGSVLLKNDNDALPLAKGSKISLVGISSIDPAYGGKGSAQTSSPQQPITPQQGFENAGFSVNKDLLNFYSANYSSYKRDGRGDDAKINDASWEAIKGSTAYASFDTYNDAAIFTISRVGGEGSDFSSTKTDGENGDYLKLNANEKSVLQGLKALKDSGKIKKVILLINSANPIHGSILDDESLGIDAALWIGTVGITGFNGIANVISGSVNPSGHLTDIWYKDLNLNPVSKNWGSTVYSNASDFDLPTENKLIDRKYSTYVSYSEGIYVGYRYAETRYYDKVINRTNVGDFDYNSTIYRPFGYGASYTTFAYSDMQVKKHSKTIDITVTVKNTGTKAGKDAVQIYVQKPYTEKDAANGIENSAVELVGFGKTDTILPNESENITITVDKEELATYDANVEKTYVLEGGDYYFTAAHDSHNAVNNILAKQGYTNLDTTTVDSKLVEKLSYSNDISTYSKSSTGKAITNIFDYADMNKYEGKNKNSVTYLSRNNWAGTYPTKTTELLMTSKLQDDLLAIDNPSAFGEDTVEYPKYGVNSGLQLIDLLKDEEGNKIPFDSTIWDTFMDQLSWDQTVALISVGLQKTNGVEAIGKPETLDHNGPCGLTKRYGDNKNGLAARINDPDKNLTPPYYPSVGIIGATFDHKIATDFGDMLGEDAIRAGYAGFYGIGVNTHRSAYQGRAYEYWSEDPFLAGTMAALESKKMQEHGCNVYIKHLAVNDQEDQRNGVSVWANEQTLREIYLKPFRMAVEKGNAVNAMAAFGRIGAKHCAGNKELLTTWLREEVGMTGHVVTDMYNIGYKETQFIGFLMAGCDIPDGEIASATFNQFKTGHGEVANQMRLAAKRILYSTLHSIGMNGITSSTRLVPVTPPWQIALISVDSVLAVLFAASVGYTIFVIIKTKKN